jgi:hypothetical protein
MPRFLGVHSMKGLDEDILKKHQDSRLDEFSVKHLNILYNPEADMCFCLLEAPTKRLLRIIMRKWALSVSGLQSKDNRLT